MPKKKAWYSFAVQEVFSQLRTNESGLEKKEVEKRLQKFGKNELIEERPLSELKLVFSQFKSVLIYILLIAAFVSGILAEWVDFGIILAAVIVNVIVGYFQESKAQRALFELKKYLKLKAIVYRNGNKVEIPVEELVPGDIVYLQAGNQVPADCRLINVNQFQVQEAILTGESEPVIKHVNAIVKKNLITAEKKNMVFMGTLISGGTALAVVVNTGMKTEIGQIADLLQKTEEEQTPFQLQLQKFGKKIGLILLSLALILFIYGMAVGRSFTEIFTISVATAVSAIPEGLPIAVTVTLAIGMQRILKKKSLVRKLVAAETLGSTSVICVDKTGTITTGMMKVEKISTMSRDLSMDKKKLNMSEQMLLLSGALCNNATITNPKQEMGKWKIIGSPTEKAILDSAIVQNIDVLSLQEKHERLAEIPFSSRLKMMFTLNKFDKDKNYVFCKGAPEKVLDLCTYYQNGKPLKLTKDVKNKLSQKHLEYSQQGYRLLAAAYKFQSVGEKQINKDENYVFLGFFIIRDPLRPDVKKIIRNIKSAGIKIVMITGDHVLTATSIAKEMGLKVSDDSVISGEQLAHISDMKLSKVIKKVNVFARISPKDKFRIVQAFQAAGEVVAMTGDGVNDAPALKAADVGIAVGAGSEITKQTADLILLDNRLSTIVDAIREGRVIFANIKKVIVYLLSDSFTEIILIFGSLLAGLPLPLTAAQILWINLVSDSLPAASLTLEKEDISIMDEKPRPKKARILDGEMISIIFIIGIITDLILFGLFLWLFKSQGIELDHIRTFMFGALGIDTLFYIFSCRSLRHSILKIKPWTNKWLLAAVGFGALMIVVPIYIPILQKIFDFTPLNLMDWVILVGLALTKVVGIEIVKYIFVGRKRKN